MAEVTSECPTLTDYLEGEQCHDNISGVSPNIYIALKGDLEAPLVLTGCTYSEPKFKAGKGFFKLECKDESNKIEGSLLGANKGNKLTINAVIDAVNSETALLSRGLANLKWFAVVKDGEKWQIMYDPERKIKVDNDGIKTSTGAASSDERTTTITATLQPVPFINLYVTITDITKLQHDYVAPGA